MFEMFSFNFFYIFQFDYCLPTHNLQNHLTNFIREMLVLLLRGLLSHMFDVGKYFWSFHDELSLLHAKNTLTSQRSIHCQLAKERSLGTCEIYTVYVYMFAITS